MPLTSVSVAFSSSSHMRLLYMGSPVSGSITNLVMVDVKPWPYMMSNYHS